MTAMQSLSAYFTKNEKILWFSSVFFIIVSFLIFDRSNFLTLAASLIGVTSLIFAAKGNPIAQLLMILFSFLYGFISFSFSYYGEMLTYLGMTMPMAIISFITWMRNPFEGNQSEVQVNRIEKREVVIMLLLTVLVTIVFYQILRYFHTANLIPSTLSVATSFLAVYLTSRRSPFYAIGYAANDIVLIILWSLAALEQVSYLSVVICFIAFLANDLYGFISWRKMMERQNREPLPATAK